MKSIFIVALLGLASLGASAQQDGHRFEVELELSPAWQNKNDVQIPNTDMGTRFSLKDLVGTGPWATGRFYFTWNIKGRHGMRVLLAPLGYTETGRFDMPVDFAGESYLPGVATEAKYQFNSWRATYRYQFKNGERWRWWVGFTAKIRDAEIRLTQGATTSNDTDTGFVPLLHLRGDWQFAQRWHFILDLDALAGGPGRAEDLSLKLAYDVADRWSVLFGYRTVEGGVDIDRVYNFAWFNYAVVSATHRF